MRFDLAGSDDRELPLILGLMPVLAKHAINPETFEETSFDAADRQRPLRRRRGRSRQERDAQAQSRTIGGATCRSIAASGISTRSGSTTIATPIRISRRSSAACYDVRTENDPARWQTGYDFPALRDGRVVKEALPTGLPKASSYFVFNTRRAGLLRHPRARGDLAAVRLRMDQPQLSSSTSIGARRATSKAPSCPRTAGRPMRASARCSRRFPARCAPTCSTAPGRRRSATAPAATAPCCGARSTCSRRPATSCAAPSWSSAQTGRPFTFEIMVDDARRRAAGAAVLRRASSAPASRRGCARSMRCSSTARRLAYDFDMIQNRWDQSLSPGNEQAFYWGSAAADAPGTRNYMGVKSPAVDAMIAALLKAREPRRLRRRGARARPRADLRLLRRAAVSSAGAVDRALDHDRASAGDLALRLSSRNLVAASRKSQ